MGSVEPATICVMIGWITIGALFASAASRRVDIGPCCRVNKECPYCGVDLFGLWDLFKLTLDYSTPSECRNCGGLVRNSGRSQFLTLLTTALLIGLDFILLSPFVPEWVVFSSLIALVPLPTMLFAKPVRAEVPQTDLPPFIADPNNDKAITVSGWNEEELDKALADFTGQDTGWPPKVDIQKRFENLYRLTFPEDISVFNFIALVNYLNYPIDLGSPEREITVAGKTTLNSAFAGIPESLWGKHAILYVPENDEDHDVVYVQTEAGAFANSFNQEGGWRRVDDPRLSGEVKALTETQPEVLKVI